MAKREKDFATEWAQALIDSGVVTDVNSPYAAAVVVAPKKDEHGVWTDLRFAIDYRGLNAITVRDQYQCPTGEEIMARLEGSSLFTTMDA